MKKIVFITKSLNINCIKGDFIATSSGAFEYGLVNALSKIVDLDIIHLGVSELKIKKIGELNFSSINYKSVFGFFRLAKEIVNRNKSGQIKILTTGYYPVEIGIVLIISKILNIKSFCYIYDTHRQAISKMSFIKKELADIYFKLGLFFAKKSSGLLVLNDSFIKNDLIKTPYFKTKVGVNHRENVNNFNKDTSFSLKSKKTIFVFAGTINSENGAGLLVEVLNKNKRFNLEIHFYGDGEDVLTIQDLEKVDSRVKYFGRISDDVLQKKLIEADYLINLRDPFGISVNYSFPSKLIKFMATGTPVISNNFPGLDDCYINHIHLISEYNVQAISEKIGYLLMKNLDRSIGAAAKEIVNKENDWNKISEELIGFMN